MTNLPPNVQTQLAIGDYTPVMAKITETGSISYKLLNDAGRVISGNAGKLPEFGG